MMKAIFVNLFTVKVLIFLLLSTITFSQENNSVFNYGYPNEDFYTWDSSPANPSANQQAYQITGNAITLEAWIFPMHFAEIGEEEVIIHRNLFHNDYIGAIYSYRLILTNSGSSFNPTIKFLIGDGSLPPNYNSVEITNEALILMAKDTLSIFEWLHVAASYDGGNLKLYLNGEEVIQNTHTGSINEPAGSSGALGMGLNFFGFLDDVRLWSVARSPGEISGNKDDPLSDPTSQTGLAGYWPFDEVVGEGLVADLSGNHNDISLYKGVIVESDAQDGSLASTQIQIDKSSLDFGSNETGTFSKVQTINIQNTGSEPAFGEVVSTSRKVKVEQNLRFYRYNENRYDVKSRFYIEAGEDTSLHLVITPQVSETEKMSIALKINCNTTVQPSGYLPAEILSLPLHQIDANQIDMYVQRDGRFAGYPFSERSNRGMEWPKGEGKVIVYLSGICLGAMIDEQICTAITCGYSGSSSTPSVSEYLPGRIIGGTWDDSDQYKYRVYKIEKGIMNSDYFEWPGGLNENMGAPVHSDRTPWTGGQVGDQTLFTVYNDMNDDKHLKYMSNKMGAEVQQTIFAFNRTNELENTVFLRFRVVNKSVNTWKDTYFAFWCDPDVGYYGDDKVGIDTTLINVSDPNSRINLAFAYNSSNFDEIYQEAPPAVGYQMLKGAFFTQPLRSFAYYGPGSGYSDPDMGYEYYQYMNGKEYDNPGTAETEASLFPLSGQNLSGPNDTENWIDEGDGDKRFLLSTGPFDLNPGESKEFIAAIIVARGTDNFNSVDVLKQYAKDVKLKFDNGEIYGGAVENVSSISFDPGAEDEVLDDKENSGAVFTLSTEPTGGGTLEVASYIEAPPGTEDIVHSSIRGVGKYLEVQELGDISFPIYVQIYYTQNDLHEAGVGSENDLEGIHYWSGAENRWIKYDETDVETANDGIYEGYVWANLDHLTALRIGTKVDSALQLNTDNQFGLPTHFSLSQNYPNPFNPLTQIEYDLPKSEYVIIEVFNMLGQKIRTLVNRQMPAGTHKVTLNAKSLPSGIYIYRIQAGKFMEMKKMVLLR